MDAAPDDTATHDERAPDVLEPRWEGSGLLWLGECPVEFDDGTSTVLVALRAEVDEDGELRPESWHARFRDDDGSMLLGDEPPGPETVEAWQEFARATYDDPFRAYPDGDLGLGGLPKPDWPIHLPDESGALSLSWEGLMLATLEDDPTTYGLVQVTAEVNPFGGIVDDSWEWTWATDDGEVIHEVGQMPLQDLVEAWTQFVAETHLGTLRVLLEAQLRRARHEATSGELIDYDSPAAARQAADGLAVLDHAYSRCSRERQQALRLAVGWTGTFEEFVTTLPGILA